MKKPMYFKRPAMRGLFAVFALFFALQSAWALDLQAAKDQGLVGEAKTGYLAARQSPASAEVRALVSSVNAKRKAQFEKMARNTNTTVAQVANRFYELAVQRTKPGHYYQDASGRWVKK